MSRLVVGLLRPYRGWIAVVLAAMVVETLMSLAAPWPLKVVIDSVIGSHPLPSALSWLSQTSLGQNAMGLAAAAAILMVVIAIVGAVAGYIDSYYTESIGQWVANDLRTQIYHHLQRLSLAYYDTHQIGALVSTLTDDVSTVESFAAAATLDILIDLLTIVGMLGLMFWLDWDFALIAVAATPFLLLFVLRSKRAVKKATRAVRERESDIINVVQQGLQSVRAVKAFGRQEFEEARLGEASRATVEAALKARKVKSLVSPVVGTIVAACTAVVLWRGAGLVLSGVMTLGALTVFLAYLAKFFKPVQDLAKLTSSIAQVAVSLERITTILETDDIIPHRPGARTPSTLRGAIAFEQVAFAYDPQAPVLRNVTLTIAAGQRVGVVGPTGSGKSTVVSLIPRFYDPNAGRVTIDGIDVRDYTVPGLRNCIGFVLQDTVLFRGTVRENIAYGRSSATLDDVVRAAQLANADEFITRMPKGYDAMVGERGLTLSGGQRQRIGIARALIRNSPILILDEPTAALDTESESLVMEALEQLMKGRTVITIAHRLSTIRDADKIIVLNHGVVAEEGSHAELLALNGIYAELSRAQFGPAAASHT